MPKSELLVIDFEDNTSFGVGDYLFDFLNSVRLCFFFGDPNFLAF